MLDIPSFKIRCSAIGEIMTSPRDKGNVLSATAKKHCETWLKEQLFRRKNTFSNKYTQKGIIVEDSSIDFLAAQLGYGFLLKNEDSFENEYLTGTPDLLPPGSNEVIDIKSSWSWVTLPLFEEECPNKIYWWQLQGYMALTGRAKARLVYILSDTPIHLIEREARRYCYDNGYDDLDSDIYDMFYADMTYGDVAPSLKLKTFSFEKDENAINQIYDRVEACRYYIKNLLTKL